MHDTIILTCGWTGSSVFAALIRRAGAWLGDQTVAKPDYDTYENAELVRINKELIERFGGGIVYEHEFDRRHVQRVEQGAQDMPRQVLKEFIAICSGHEPWAWKDPRLTWTIRIWAPHLDLQRIRFLVLTRDPLQAWIAANLRRHVQSYGFTHSYNDGITTSNLAFLHEHGLSTLVLSFEDLLVRPERTLDKLNAHVDAQLTIDDLKAVCRLRLGRTNHGARDLLKAAAVYVKNYRQRDGRGRLPKRVLA